MKTKYPFILALTILISMLSCQKEEIPKDYLEESEGENFIENIDLTTSSKLNRDLLNKISEIKKVNKYTTSNEDLNGNNNNYYIGLKNVSHVKYNNKESYSLPLINLDKDEQEFKNLVLIRQEDNTFTTFLVVYDMEVENYYEDNSNVIYSEPQFIPTTIDLEAISASMKKYELDSKAYVRICNYQWDWKCRYNPVTHDEDTCSDWENYRMLVYDRFCSSVYFDSTGGGGGTGTGDDTGEGCSDPKNPDCDGSGDQVNPADELIYEEKDLVKFYLTAEDRQFYYDNSSLRTKTLELLANSSVELKQYLGMAIGEMRLGLYSTLDEYFAKNKTLFDSENTGDNNNNPSGGYDLTPYSTFNPDQEAWPSISNVISSEDFIGWGYPNIDENCFSYAKAQLALEGYTISNYWDSGQTILIYTEQNGSNSSNFTDGVSYLRYALSNDIPIIVGVDLKTGSPNPQTDNSTDHFVVIVGMGQDEIGKYFNFFDNASGNPIAGAHSENKFYYNSTDKTLSGRSMTSYGGQGERKYTVTQIRKSKSL